MKTRLIKTRARPVFAEMGMAQNQTFATPTLNDNPWQQRARRYGPILLLYLVVTALTDPPFMGDTSDYVVSLLRGVEFWEFGHLFWRPLGWLIFVIAAPVLRLFAGESATLQATLALIWLNWIAGLASVLLLHGLLLRFVRNTSSALWATGAFAFTQGVLIYVQTGASYIPGLAFYLLGLFILARYDERARHAPSVSTLPTAIGAGTSLAVAVGFWFPYVFVIPAALLFPLCAPQMRPLDENSANDNHKSRKFGDRASWRLVVQSTACFALVVGISYLAVLAILGISDIAELRAWITSAGHGMNAHGLTRVIFGLPRSLINMGNEGLLFKRFLLHDPFNPVTPLDLVRLSLWKLLAFYTFAAAIVINLWRAPRGKGAVVLLTCAALPVLGFATFFDGGAVERYLPLYPVLFLTLASSLDGERSWPALRFTTWAFVVVMGVTNSGVMAKPVIQRQETRVSARISQLWPRLRPHSILFVSHQQDELYHFKRTYVFHPANRSGMFEVRKLAKVNSDQVAHWRQDFAAGAISAWSKGGEIWLSQRVLASKPRSEWNWAEGDDHRLLWRDYSRFFLPLDKGRIVGGADGFVLIPPSPKNIAYLKGFPKPTNPGQKSHA